jgi:hypothetical protein
MNRKFLVILFGAAALAMPALAQQGASFNGTWTLNNSKSSFGQFPPPQSETVTIQINGSDFQQHVNSVNARGTQSYTRACALDGKEVTFAPDDPKAQLTPGLKLSKIQCGWDGSSVFVLETVPFQGANLTDKLTFSVAPDGSALTIMGHISSATMNGDRTYVYDKGGSASADAAPANGGGMAATPGAAAMIHAGGAQPNLSGTWKLDPAQSKFGQMPAPASQVNTITQDGSSIKIAIDQKGSMMGDMAYTESLTTDGQSATWAGMGGSQVTGTAQWQGNALVVDSKTSFQGSDVKIKDTFTLSADGNTLTEVTHAESGMGNFDSTSVFVKQ